MIIELLKNQKTPLAGSRASRTERQRTFQATITGTGDIGAQVKIQVSNDMVGWLDLGTINLAGTDMVSDGFASQPMWEHTRANLISISGTNAAVTVSMGTAGNV